MAQPRGSSLSRVRPEWLLPGAVAATLAILYVGSYLLPSSLRDAYLQQVYGRPGMALMIGSDARIDRSLYCLGDRRLVYTRHDSLEIGAVRKYRRLATPASENPTFKFPNAFVD